MSQDTLKRTRQFLSEMHNIDEASGEETKGNKTKGKASDVEPIDADPTSAFEAGRATEEIDPSDRHPSKKKKAAIAEASDDDDRDEKMDESEDEKEENDDKKSDSNDDGDSEIDFDEDDDLEESLRSIIKSDLIEDATYSQMATIVEAAITERTNARVKQVKAKLNEQFEQRLEEQREEFIDRVDTYMESVVSEWVEENKVVIESNIRNEMATGFIADVKQLLEQHNIDLPEDRIDAVEHLQEQIESLQERLDDVLAESMETEETLAEARRELEFERASRDLTESNASRLRTLSEDVSARTPDEYREKLIAIKESFFGNDASFDGSNSSKGVISEDVSENNGIESDNPVDQIASSMSRLRRAPRL